MKKLFMAIIALMMTISASAQFNIYCSDGNVIMVDSISMVAPEEPEEPTPSAGIGTFSVSADKQVTFSKGNLQYTHSTNTWSFAKNQWDMIGTDNVIGGTAFADKIDLFGWSGSTGFAKFGVSTSEYIDDYYGSFVDWGTNQIGSDAPNTWRTLTYDEWYYLRYTRTNANNLLGVAQVNGVNGLIFLPDNWTCPAGVTFKCSYHYPYQTFTAAEWSKLESAGAVFLPAAGYRRGSGVNGVQFYGYYWSATERSSGNARCLYFYWDSPNESLQDRLNGLSVRLVKDLQ